MRALIVDDEPMPGKHLKEMIKKYCFEINEVEIVLSPSKAILELKDNEYDIVFLDVEMPEMSGLDLIKKISLPKSTSVVFVTAYSEYAVEAFKADAIYYIMKPVEKGELITAVRKSMYNTALISKKPKEVARNNSITVYNGEDYVVINPSDIIRMEADGSYTKFVLKNSTFLASKRMGSFEEKLNNELFIRSHNSHLINIQEVSKISKGKGGYIIMSNNDFVPISATKKLDIETVLGL